MKQTAKQILFYGCLVAYTIAVYLHLHLHWI